jgi:glutamyl endopeptidase
MRNNLRVVFFMMGVVAMSSPVLAQSPATPVASDGTVGAVFLGEKEDARPFRGSGSLTEFTGAEPVSREEALEAAKYPPKTVGASPEAVVGWDTRMRVYPYNYYPNRAVAYITFTQGGMGYSCSGTMIGTNTVATAGHCVHQGKGGTWSTGVRVYPAYNGTTSPFGSCTAKSLHSVIGWTTNSYQNYDYGAIKLNCTVGNSTGTFGFYVPSSVAGLPSLIAGYPGDKPGKYQWLGADRVYTSSSSMVYYKTDTAGGMSGSAVWWDKLGPYIYAIHAYGYSAGYNGGARMITSMYNNYVYWKGLP